jgi:hypothetical protein
MRAPKHRHDQLHPRIRHHSAGTLPDREPDDMPVTEAGLSIEPEALGEQFLRDATEQDNFESSVPDEPFDPQAEGIAQIVSQRTLESAGQDDVDVPGSAALGTTPPDDGETEPANDDVDLLTSAIHSGSLFDRPTRGGATRTPAVHVDEIEHSTNRARQRAMDAELRSLFRYRPAWSGRSHKRIA